MSSFLARRRLLQAGAALVMWPAVPVLAQVVAPLALSDIRANVRSLSVIMGDVNLHMLAQRWPQAMQRIDAAMVFVDEDITSRWPFQRDVFLAYGYVLLGSGHAGAALQALEKARDTEKRMLADNGAEIGGVHPNPDFVIGHYLLSNEARRQLLSAVTSSTRNTRPVGTLLEEDFASINDLDYTYARALLANGREVDLVPLFERMVSKSGKPANAQLTVTLVYRFFRLGTLLVQTDQMAQAQQAFELAQYQNRRRILLAQLQGNSMSGFWAACAVERRILSVRLGIAGHQNTLSSLAENWMTEITTLKGSALRYSEELRYRLNIARDPRVRMLRDQALAIEDAIALLPANLRGVDDFITLTARLDQVRLIALRLLPTGGPVPGQVPPPLFARLRPELGDDALIGFTVYQPIVQDAARPPPLRYLRYCLSKTEHQIRDVGECGVVNRAVEGWRATLISMSGNIVSGQALFQVLLSDLPDSVVLASTWRIDPEGTLALLPFDALPDPNGKPVLLQHAIRMVNTVVKPFQPLQLDAQIEQPPRASGALIIANPQYGIDAKLPPHAYPAMTGSEATLNWRAVGEVLALPDTEIEGAAVAASLLRLGIVSKMLVGSDATCAALTAAAQPLVLHIAAHAVILDSATQALESNGDGGIAINEIIDLVLPGRRSALVLSREGKPDLMLAKDVARLSLQDTALVVLSACSTGDGDIMAGEGIASLRRCVEFAGAASTVTSVWAVSSAATVVLMTHFYAGLERGQTICHALHSAKRTLHAAGRPSFEWAGFMMAGADVTLGTGQASTCPSEKNADSSQGCLVGRKDSGFSDMEIDNAIMSSRVINKT
jgi:hypothetical protein